VPSQSLKGSPLSNPFGLGLLVALSFVFGPAPALQSQEKPYFITYSQDLEEPGNLEIESKTTLGQPEDANRFGAMNVEFEYGVLAWWTTELYLDGQTTANESTLFTGFRLENRFRPLMREHFINPVIYVEYEDINGADKMLLEVVGHDGQADLSEPNGEARKEQKHEAELKLILSSNVKDWNISENFIAEKSHRGCAKLRASPAQPTTCLCSIYCPMVSYEIPIGSHVFLRAVAQAKHCPKYQMVWNM